MTKPTTDLLSAEERRVLAAYSSAPIGSEARMLANALARLAPPPPPPEPRLSELAAIWRHRLKVTCPLPTDITECADELDSALERWRERLTKNGAARDRFSAVMRQKIAGATLPASDAAADVIICDLLFKEYLP
jgi:hypothetical protein